MTSINDSWPTLSFICDKDHIEDINEYINNLVAEDSIISISFTDAIDEDFTDIFEPELNTMPLWDKTKVSIIFDESINLEEILPKFKQSKFQDTITLLEISKTEDKKEYYEQALSSEPIYYGKDKNLILYPNNDIESNQNLVSNLSYFNLSPGLAFGTGQHETTTLCLNWLADNIPNLLKQNSNLEILDFGCGSGILSIAAARLGAKNITAIDHDPQAIIATNSNALNNHCQNNISAIKDNNIILNKKFPIILANILANTLIELSEVITSHLENNGLVILSGILDNQKNEVINVYKKYNMELIIG